MEFRTDDMSWPWREWGRKGSIWIWWEGRIQSEGPVCGKNRKNRRKGSCGIGNFTTGICSVQAFVLAASVGKNALRQTLDYAIDLTEGSEPPWGSIYPMSQYQLNTLKTYLDEMLAQGNITHSHLPAGRQSCLYQNPTVAYDYVWTTDNSTNWRFSINLRSL